MAAHDWAEEKTFQMRNDFLCTRLGEITYYGQKNCRKTNN